MANGVFLRSAGADVFGSVGADVFGSAGADVVGSAGAQGASGCVARAATVVIVVDLDASVFVPSGLAIVAGKSDACSMCCTSKAFRSSSEVAMLRMMVWALSKRRTRPAFARPT